ncbi:MAG TPA: MFS transporter [Anaerolineales bacterium]|nr:MFS transporter [Anaerolineales bacterium]
MSLKTRINNQFPALGSRDFSIFFVGQFLSLVGTWMQNTTQPYLAYRLSGSPFDLGLIAMAASIPTFLLALPAGVIVEQYDKRKTVIAMQLVMMVQAFLLAWLTITGRVELWHMLVLSLLLGAAGSVEITARQAMLIEMVGYDSLPNAIALQSTIFNLARVIGPTLIVPFLVFIENNGEGYAFLANGISYLVIIISLFFVRTPYKRVPDTRKISFVANTKESLNYISKTRSVGMIILMATILGFFGFPVTQQVPVFARDILSASGDTEAMIATKNSLIYTTIGIGSLTAAFTLAAFNPKAKGKILLTGQLLFIFGLIALYFIKVLPLYLVIFALMGYGTVSSLATMNTLIQLQVPNELRGRVFSTYLWGLQGIAPFGSLLIGWLAANVGILETTLFSGAVCLLLILAIHWKNPQIRTIKV